MSSTVSLIPTTTASAPSSSTLGVGIGLIGTGGGLFGHILNLDSNSLQTDDTSQSALSLKDTLSGGTTTGGLDSSILTLPQELSSLSTEDLQLLIDKNMSGEETIIDNKTLKIFTLGIPNVGEVTDDATQENTLLSATDVTPSTLPELKLAIKAIKEDSNINKDVTEESVELDANEISDAMILVMYVPVQPQTTTVDYKDFELDPSTFSSLTKITQPKSSSSDLIDDGIDLYEGTDSPLSLTGDDGKKMDFQGSIASLKTHNDNHKEGGSKSSLPDVNGQLSSALGTTLTGGMDMLLSEFEENSLLIANSNSSSPASANTNPLFTSASATGTHPTTQLVAKMIEKAATGSDKAKQELSVQLDPPELGRMQIHLSMEKGETMKIRLVAETQETLSLLQRDSHALKSALESAGIQTDSSSLSFDLSGGNQSFNQLLGGSQQDASSQRTTNLTLNSDGSVIREDQLQNNESEMSFVKDSSTGYIRYSLIA